MNNTLTLLTALLLASQVLLHAADPASSPAPSAVRIEKDVAYLSPERTEKADLYLPPQFEPGKKYPGIVIIHGGGWSAGDKDSGRERNIAATLVPRGYVCMSINYLLATKETAAFPQNIRDCKRAVRWLRKNAARFHLDTEHIGAIGGSAGGHLTALLAVSGPDTGIDPPEDAEYSCRVQAAVPMYPHCASSWEAGVGPKHVVYTKLWMFAKSQTEAPSLWDSASPIKQLSKDDPPMLILHGTADKTTPLDQSTRLNEAAKKIGVPSELILVEGAGHSFHLQPKQRDLRPDVIAFFDKHLKPEAPQRWPLERAWEWYRSQPWIVGFNFVPSTACNTTEMWSEDTFDAATIAKELGMGAKLGFNSCRVFVQYLVWKNDPDGLKKRIARFLSIAESHGLSTTLVLFDDCSFGVPRQTEPYMGKQREPIPGMILPSWTPSPGLKAVTDKTVRPDLEKYIKDIVGTFAKDKRVLMWDLYNEAGNSGMGNKSRPLVEAAFAWARQAGPEQPLTSCWLAEDLSDVVSFHSYTDYKGLEKGITNRKKQQRPVICTEWMARPLGSKWETDLALFKQQGVGCYNWGLVNGRTQCQFAWSNKPGTPEPKVWFHDLFHNDGTAYDPAEHEVIRKVTADKKIDWTATDPVPKPFTEESITFSPDWNRWEGAGPAGRRLWYANTAGETATKEVTGNSIELVLKHGPDCGIASVTIDGKPAEVPEIDTYTKKVDWIKKTVVAKDLPAGKHKVVVTATGRKAAAASNSYVQLVNITGSEPEH